MKKLAALPLCLGCVFAAGTSHAIDLKQSKVTQVVNDVEIISAADQQEKSAVVNEIFSMPDILRTGTASRAELTAADETVTRVGADTIFSFDPANRTIDLKQGSLLFHSPHGKGGGTIHTGSATASVLGTTIIVVTTPNGGFKVLDLEGKVEVHFLNGLKQKLDPGQMTFILPGANQLAPVIIFRLDELIQNSLLVKGFSQPLASLPLIQNQVDRQIKLIQSGKATDTGLYAGDDASPNQVEVLDVNTISHSQQPPTPTPAPPPATPTLAEAEAADATINQPSLTDISIPTPPDHIFTGSPFSLTGNSFFGGQYFSGFIARNIYIQAPSSDQPSITGAKIENPSVLQVNLIPYASLGSFDLVAVNDISVAGSVTFQGLSTSADLALIAGNQFILSPGASVGADTADLLLSSPATLTLDNVSLYNGANNLSLTSGADVDFQNGALASAQGKLNVNAGNNISAADTQFTAGSAQFTSLNGTIKFDNTTLDASSEDATSHAIFTAPTALNFNYSTLNSGNVVLNGTGLATITLNYTTINAPTSLTAISAGDLNITGSTLNTDPESGTINLVSAFGSANISGTSITANTLTVSAGDSITYDGGEPEDGAESVSHDNARSATRTAHYLTVNSGDGILLDASGHHARFDNESIATASFTAPNLITVNNADFTSYAVVNMAANTIVLSDVALAPNDTFTSGNHALAPNPNTYQPVVYGDVNFQNNVTTHNGVLITVPEGFVNGTIPGTGIVIR